MKGEALIYGVPVGLSATQIQVSEMPQDKNQETRDVGSQNELLGSGSWAELSSAQVLEIEPGGSDVELKMCPTQLPTLELLYIDKE